MKHASISGLEKTTINNINNYLNFTCHEPFSTDFIKAIQNTHISNEIENTLGLNFRGFFIDLSHSDNPEEANMLGIVLSTAINGSYTDVLLLHPNLEPSGIKQILM